MSTNETQAQKSEPTTDVQYTYHTEPPAVGGAEYVRCETCGVECVPAEPDRLSHRDGCPHGDR